MTEKKEEVVEAEVVDGTAIVHVEAQPLGRSFWSASPTEMIEVATEQATALKAIIDAQGMSTQIRKKTHVNIEGWQTLGAMVGVFGVVEWTRELVDDDGVNLGWEARVQAVTADGNLVGGAEAECRRTESTWSKRDSYALRSMAQTRAQSKALRGPLGFIVHIAGYSATPQEEMENLLSPYQRTAALAVKLAGDKEKGKVAYLDALQTANIDAVTTEDEASTVMAILEDAFPGPGEDVPPDEAPF